MTSRDTMGVEADVRVLPDAQSVARSAAELFAQSAVAAIEDRRRFNVALAGGSTPKAMYELLAAGTVGRDVHWPKVRVYFSDERCVPPDHADSNYRLANETLLEHVNVCSNCIHRIPAELAPEKAADEYERLLRDQFDDPPDRFDLVLLGMGQDGHTASLFPGSEALGERERWCVANYVPTLCVHRITLTYPILNAARRIAYTVTGSHKADAVRAVLTGPIAVVRRPAQGIRPTDGELIWLIDQAAASLLPPDAPQR